MPTEERFVIASYKWEGTQDNQLPLEVGKIYQVLQKTENGWARGQDKEGNEGFFPYSFVRECTNEEVTAHKAGKPQEEATNENTPKTETVEESPNTTEPQNTGTSTQEEQSKKKMRSSAKSSLRKDSDASEKKKKKSRTTDKVKRRRTSTKKGADRRGTSFLLQQFEDKSKSVELSWARQYVGFKQIEEIFLLPEQLQNFLNVLQAHNEKRLEYITNENREEGKKASSKFLVEIEGCEWAVFEWHQLIKSTWLKRKQHFDTKLEETSTYLDKLVKFQQARCFQPESVEKEIQTFLVSLADKKIVDVPSVSETQLDVTIQRMRDKANGERENSLFIVDSSNLLDEIAEQTSLAVSYMTLCHYFTSILSSALIIDADDTTSRPPPKTLEGTLPDLLVDLLYTKISFNTLEVRFAELLGKIVSSCGLLNPILRQLVLDNSSLSELFAQHLSLEFIRTYRSQIEILSSQGAHRFSVSVVARILSLIGNAKIDLTRPIVEQLITKLASTVVPGHVRAVEGNTSLLFRGSSVFTVSIPSELERMSYVSEYNNQCTSFFEGGAAPVVDEKKFLVEAEVLVRSAWEVHSGTSCFSIQYPKHFPDEELGKRRATKIMFDLLQEIGWSPCDERVPTAPVSAVDGSELEKLKKQIEAQDALIQQNVAALSRLSQLVSSLQQQLQVESEGRISLQNRVDSMTSEYKELPPVPVSQKGLLPVPPSRTLSVSPRNTFEDLQAPTPSFHEPITPIDDTSKYLDEAEASADLGEAEASADLEEAEASADLGEAEDSADLEEAEASADLEEDEETESASFDNEY